MESVIGTVNRVRNDVATIVVDSPVVCRRCATGNGCGAGLLSATDKPKLIDVTVPRGMILRPGTRVRLSMSPAKLLRAAMIAYGLPLFCMLAFVALAAFPSGALTDLAAVIVAILGLFVGLAASRYSLKRDAACEHFVPIVAGIAGQDDE
jgi:positive regulator of sigma E activity